MFKLIKRELSCANAKKGEQHDVSPNTNADKKVALQVEFYGHIKSWLSPRMRAVSQSDIAAVQISISDFQSALAEVEAAEDEEEVLAFITTCECIVEECKEALPL